MIDELGKLRLLEPEERRCLAQAVFLLSRVRLALWLKGYGFTRTWVDGRIALIPLSRHPRLDVASVTRMIAVAGRLIPGSTCLVRALGGEGRPVPADWPVR